MKDWLAIYMTSNSGQFYVHQLLTIIMVYILGYVVIECIGGFDGKNREKGARLAASLAFPVGLCLVVFVGYLFITFGIAYNSVSMTIALIIVAFACVVYRLMRPRKLPKRAIKSYIIVAAILVIVAMVATSGQIWMSVSNDSLYYFWQYPRAIVEYQGIRDQFDNFLTDTGLGAAVIGTLPFLYGFGESFGIQEFFHISFLLFAGFSSFDMLSELYPNMAAKKICFISTISAILMAVSTPVFILAHWAMANMYFMELFVIGIGIMFYINRIKDADNLGLWIIYYIIVFACAQIRMEGGIFILFMIVMQGTMTLDKKRLAIALVPIVILQTLFEAKIFIMYTIDSPYTFMTKGKALIQLVAYIAVIVYVLFIDSRLPELISKYKIVVILLGLILVNAILLVLEPEHYIANIRAFVGNMLGQSGWGIVPYVTVFAAIILIIWEIMLSRNEKARDKDSILGSAKLYWLITTVGFVLVTIAVSFARGDNLSVVTGDSGNRVMLQICPLIIYTFVLWFTDAAVRDARENG